MYKLYLLCIWVMIFDTCAIEDGDLGFGLNIGNAIDVFANYGDLSQVTQVISADYEEDVKDVITPFNEKNIKVFVNATSRLTLGNGITEMHLQLCDTFEDLLDAYFKNFQIEGTSKPWKAFMGDWILDEIMRTLGIEYDQKPDNCCYVLIKIEKRHKGVQLNDIEGVAVKEYVNRAITNLNVSDPSEVRKFMKSYGTHYIDSYTTGNFIYQVFKYKRTGYSMLTAYVKNWTKKPDNLRFYFSSYFLKHIGEIRVASGNKTIETWAKLNLRDSQYLYSRPSLLRLHYNSLLTFKLNELLDNKALLGLKLKILKPLFKEEQKSKQYTEIVENDLLLWEVNA